MTVVSTPAAPAGQLFSGPPLYQASTPWGPWGALGATVLLFGGQLLGVVVVVAIYAALYGVSELRGINPEMFFSFAKPVGIATMIGSQLGAIALLWLLANRQQRRADTLKLNPPYPSWATCVIGGLMIIVITGIVEYALYQVLKEDIYADSKFLADGLNSPLWPFTFLVAVVLAPLWEELTFRGFLLSALAQTRLGFWGAALICNVIWTALHAQYGISGLVSVFVSGLILSWLVWRTGSIRAPVIAHGIANFAAVIFAYMMNPALQGAAG